MTAEIELLLIRGLPGSGKTTKGVVAWARLVYARPVNAPEPAEEWDEVVDIEFHNRPEKPEGDGWRPLVLADPAQANAPTEMARA